MITVTGGTGHIGNVLVRELVKMGEKVRVLILTSEDASSLDGLNIEKVNGDVCDLDSLVTAFKGSDIVYHLAGIVSIIPGRYDMLYNVNVKGTCNVVEACRKAGVRRLVYTSSVHAFTEPPRGTALTETTGFNPDLVVGNYARTKAMATLIVLDGVKKGLDAVIVHPSGVIGPYEFKISDTGQMIIDFVNHRIPGCINGGYDFVDVRDVVYGLISACKAGQKGQSYILSGEYITLNQLFSILEDVTGVKSPKAVFPRWLAVIAFPFIYLYCMVRKIKPIITPYSLHTISSNSMISHEKASKELGYSPRPIKETLLDTVKWLKETGKI